MTAFGSDSNTACSTSPEVLAVDLQRQGHVAAKDDPVDVVEHVDLHAGRRRASGRAAGAARRARARRRGQRRRARGRTTRRAAPAPGTPPRVGVRVAVRDERERGAPIPSISSPHPETSRGAAHSPSAARTNARSPGRRPSSLRPSASIRRTSSASRPTPALNENRRPATRPSPMERVAPRAAKRAATTGVPAQPEGAQQHAGATTEDEAERDVPRHAVQDLVVRPVARGVNASTDASCVRASSIASPARAYVPPRCRREARRRCVEEARPRRCSRAG